MTITISRKTLAVIALAVGVAVLVACSPSGPPSAGVERRAVEQQQSGLAPLLNTQPPYFPPYSDERRNINERTARYANPTAISYITVIVPLTGAVFYSGVVKGKVSSVDSQVTPADGLDCQHYGAHDPRPDGCGVVQIAEPDGSWGTNNASAVFWFDDKDHYHETVLPYFLSDAPQTFTVAPLLTISATAQVANKCDQAGNNCHP